MKLKNSKKVKNPKAAWFSVLAKLSPKKRQQAVCSGNIAFFRDLRKLVKFVGRKKGLNLTPKHSKLFKKHKSLLKRIAKASTAHKVKKILLKRLRGGAFPLIPLIASVIPSLVSIASTEIPKLFG